MNEIWGLVWALTTVVCLAWVLVLGTRGTFRYARRYFQHGYFSMLPPPISQGWYKRQLDKLAWPPGAGWHDDDDE